MTTDGSEQGEATERQEPRGGVFLNVVPAALYVIAVFYAGGMPAASLPGTELTFGDKVLHAIAFAGMQIAMFRAVRQLARDRGAAWQIAVAFAVTSGFGALLELYQLGLPHRSAEWLDLLADVFGAGVVALLQRARWRTPADAHG